MAMSVTSMTTKKMKWKKCLSMRIHLWDIPNENGVDHDVVDDYPNRHDLVIGNARGGVLIFKKLLLREREMMKRDAVLCSSLSESASIVRKVA